MANLLCFIFEQNHCALFFYYNSLGILKSIGNITICIDERWNRIVISPAVRYLECAMTLYHYVYITPNHFVKIGWIF